MANTTAVYARIDTELKENAEGILAKLGITPSGAIQMLYSQIVLQNGLPFEARIPAKKPLDISKMTEEEISNEVLKGLKSAESRVYTVDEVDEALHSRYGI
ncbi:MAG: type II toxin-antitoxin system RelB/DinJ family antitoxin [Oscillospiraceae bacterium]|nr:type II toxin-antitoxin system RelB/DinJ family antitoxin [Oscillospiraceae bacterium]